MHVITPTRTLIVISKPYKVIAKCVAGYLPTYVSKVCVLLIYTKISLVTRVVVDQVLIIALQYFPLYERLYMSTFSNNDKEQ